MSFIRVGGVLAEEDMAQVAGTSSTCYLDALYLYTSIRAREFAQASRGGEAQTAGSARTQTGGEARTPWLESSVILMAPS